MSEPDPSSRVPPVIKAQLGPQELKDLFYAKSLLENPGFTARIANVIGTPIEKGFKLLPKNWSAVVNNASKAALTRALQVAVATLGTRRRARSSEGFHKLLVGASGGIGGAFGLAALPIELPVSTTIMLRSIADIARSEGHSISTVQTRLNCLEVFALGGRTHADDATESSYWAVRAALAKAVSEAATYVTQRGVLEKPPPPSFASSRRFPRVSESSSLNRSQPKPSPSSALREARSSTSFSWITFRTWRADISSSNASKPSTALTRCAPPTKASRFHSRKPSANKNPRRFTRLGFGR
jgi:hypothetical protein